ncbi:MAG: type II secretion system protein N [Gammaproteobacteria bacterium]|nr:type II secretion system protein N [Gammaproteobacteria bacterium]
MTILGIFPAHGLNVVISSLSQQRIQLYDPNGTIWSGSGRLVYQVQDKVVSLASTPIAWNITFHRWGLQIHLHPEGFVESQAVATVDLFSRRWQLEQLSMSIPLSFLSHLGAPWNTLKIKGQLEAKLTSPIQWQDKFVEGGFRLQLTHISTNLSPLNPIGSYLAQAQIQENKMRLDWTTLEGPLTLTGVGHWQSGRFQFTGVAQPTHPDFTEPLANLLSVVGVKNGSLSQINLSLP